MDTEFLTLTDDYKQVESRWSFFSLNAAKNSWPFIDRAERAQPGCVPCLGRTAIHDFIATLSPGDLCFVEWRIVPLVEQQPDEGAIPFVGM